MGVTKRRAARQAGSRFAPNQQPRRGAAQDSAARSRRARRARLCRAKMPFGIEGQKVLIFLKQMCPCYQLYRLLGCIRSAYCSRSDIEERHQYSIPAFSIPSIPTARRSDESDICGLPTATRRSLVQPEGRPGSMNLQSVEEQDKILLPEGPF